MLNLALILEDSAKRYPAKVAFTFMDTSLTYAQVNAAASKVANGLKAIGLQAGDKVALSCLNLPAFPIIYFGIIKAGAGGAAHARRNMRGTAHDGSRFT